MLRRNLFGTSMLCATAAMAQTAVADVTAQDVWDSYTATYESTGAQVIGAPTVVGGDTIIADSALLYRFPFGSATLRVTLPELRLTEQSDGTVQINYPDAFDMKLEVDVPNEGAGSLTFGFSQANYAGLASGTPDDITFTQSADSFVMEAKDLDVPNGPGEFTMLLNGDGYTTVSRVVVDDMVTTTTEATTAPMEIAYVLSDPEGAVVSNTGTIGAGSSEYESALPAGGSDVMQLSSALLAGAYLRGTGTSEGGSSETVTTIGGDLVSQQSQTSGLTTTRFAIDENGLDIFGEGEAIDFNMLAPDLFPFPIEGGIGSVTGGYQFPLLPSPDPQDVSLRLDISDVTLGDNIWNVFDPTNQLPRDPATINIDAAGTVISDFDLLNFATLEQQFSQAVPPISLETLTINEIEVEAIGASALASGAFTIDNSDTTTFAGFPRPEGSAILNVTGANALIDRLVAFGVIGQEEAGMARLGMGFIARSTGDDSFESRLDVNEEGHVLVNGQRMR